jgi:ATP-dependent RNA helicase DDX5/DBP2
MNRILLLSVQLDHLLCFTLTNQTLTLLFSCRDDRDGGRSGGGGSGSRSYGGSRGGGGGGRDFGNGRPRRNSFGEDSDSEAPAAAAFTTVKCFYDETKQGVRRDPEEVNQYYEQEKIAVTGVNAPVPFLEFTDYPWPKMAVQLFRRNNYIKPTPIQAQCWPIAISGRDLIGIAVTGSGKTMAYTLPAFIHIEGNQTRQGRGPMVLVLAPTRELAQQIDEVVNQFSYITSACVYGGAPRGPQISKIQRDRPDIIIATPGRLIDYLREGVISMSNVSYVVLDEADRMLDMGFEPQIRKIFKRISARDRQTLMFSATWPKEVRRLAEDFLSDPVQVKIGSTELQANSNITQIVDVCKQGDKLDKLFELMQKIMQNKENKTIIFADMKKKVDYLARMLKSQRYQVAAIHGDKTQSQRNFILRGFKEDRFSILIATDVAARGLGKYTFSFYVCSSRSFFLFDSFDTFECWLFYICFSNFCLELHFIRSSHKEVGVAHYHDRSMLRIKAQSNSCRDIDSDHAQIFRVCIATLKAAFSC